LILVGLELHQQAFFNKSFHKNHFAFAVYATHPRQAMPLLGRASFARPLYVVGSSPPDSWVFMAHVHLILSKEKQF